MVVSGSSPLARGTAAWLTLLLSLLRFIPAGAGNSENIPSVTAGVSVHPRWRGEQVDLQRGLARQGRFIPAGAGNSDLTRWSHHDLPVHPRWRGEQIDDAARTSDGGGSSPLARGTVKLRTSDLINRRFIPAGAGNRD